MRYEYIMNSNYENSMNLISLIRIWVKRTINGNHFINRLRSNYSVFEAGSDEPFIYVPCHVSTGNAQMVSLLPKTTNKFHRKWPSVNQDMSTNQEWKKINGSHLEIEKWPTNRFEFHQRIFVWPSIFRICIIACGECNSFICRFSMNLPSSHWRWQTKKNNNKSTH